jgi:hypothetical protein
VYFENHAAARKVKQTREEDRPEGMMTFVQRYSLLRYTPDGRNQAYVLVAVMFLLKKLQERLILWRERSLELTPNRHFFTHLARALQEEEPGLEGVTGAALLAMYERLIQKYKDVRSTMPDTGSESVPTFLLGLVKKLVDLHEPLVGYASADDTDGEIWKQDEDRRIQSLSTRIHVATPLDWETNKKRKENPSPEQISHKLHPDINSIVLLRFFNDFLALHGNFLALHDNLLALQRIAVKAVQYLHRPQ